MELAPSGLLTGLAAWSLFGPVQFGRLARTRQLHVESPHDGESRVFNRRRRLTKTRASAYWPRITTTGH